MLNSDRSAFVSIRDDSESHGFFAGKVLEEARQDFAVEFTGGLDLKVGAEMNVFAIVSERFSRQRSKVVECRPLGASQIVVFKKIGTPTVAEKRAEFRLSIVGTETLARIDNEGDCRVLDLGPRGFAASLPRQLKVGGIVNVQITSGSISFFTLARVRTTCLLPDGMFRHGFCMFDPRRGAGRATATREDSLREDRVRRHSDSH